MISYFYMESSYRIFIEFYENKIYLLFIKERKMRKKKLKKKAFLVFYSWTSLWHAEFNGFSDYYFVILFFILC